MAGQRGSLRRGLGWSKELGIGGRTIRTAPTRSVHCRGSVQVCGVDNVGCL